VIGSSWRQVEVSQLHLSQPIRWPPNHTRAGANFHHVQGRYLAEAAELEPAERVIFRRFRDDYTGKYVLDLGVGGGRTAPWLAPHAASYVGIDYSPEMVRAARSRYPEWDFRPGDARGLAGFDPQSVDFVLFALNGIDSVDHADRMRVLRCVGRVLKPGGLLVFSSHNLDMTAAPASFRSIVQIERSAGPVRFAKDIARAAISVLNYARNRDKQVRDREYAILIDPSYRCQFLNYYIGATAQRRQLAEAGFTGRVEVFARDGSLVDRDTTSHFLHYVTRRPAAPSASGLTSSD
ncbi:MAG: class I SAM-dependent methyltransferase, partial [Pseudomonadota bacterium]|nr:class I SAM-dependent methyltransferase [Pseudomonadota bacterium]